MFAARITTAKADPDMKKRTYRCCAGRCRRAFTHGEVSCGRWVWKWNEWSRYLSRYETPTAIDALLVRG